MVDNVRVNALNGTTNIDLPVNINVSSNLTQVRDELDTMDKTLQKLKNDSSTGFFDFLQDNSYLEAFNAMHTGLTSLVDSLDVLNGSARGFTFGIGQTFDKFSEQIGETSKTLTHSVRNMITAFNRHDASVLSSYGDVLRSRGGALEQKSWIREMDYIKKNGLNVGSRTFSSNDLESQQIAMNALLERKIKEYNVTHRGGNTSGELASAMAKDTAVAKMLSRAFNVDASKETDIARGLLQYYIKQDRRNSIIDYRQGYVSSNNHGMPAITSYADLLPHQFRDQYNALINKAPMPHQGNLTGKKSAQIDAIFKNLQNYIGQSENPLMLLEPMIASGLARIVKGTEVKFRQDITDRQLGQISFDYLNKLLEVQSGVHGFYRDLKSTDVSDVLVNNKSKKHVALTEALNILGQDGIIVPTSVSDSAKSKWRNTMNLSPNGVRLSRIDYQDSYSIPKVKLNTMGLVSNYVDPRTYNADMRDILKAQKMGAYRKDRPDIPFVSFNESFASRAARMHGAGTLGYGKDSSGRSALPENPMYIQIDPSDYFNVDEDTHMITSFDQFNGKHLMNFLNRKENIFYGPHHGKIGKSQSPQDSYTFAFVNGSEVYALRSDEFERQEQEDKAAHLNSRWNNYNINGIVQRDYAATAKQIDLTRKMASPSTRFEDIGVKFADSDRFVIVNTDLMKETMDIGLKRDQYGNVIDDLHHVLDGVILFDPSVFKTNANRNGNFSGQIRYSNVVKGMGQATDWRRLYADSGLIEKYANEGNIFYDIDTGYHAYLPGQAATKEDIDFLSKYRRKNGSYIDVQGVQVSKDIEDEINTRLREHFVDIMDSNVKSIISNTAVKNVSQYKYMRLSDYEKMFKTKLAKDAPNVIPMAQYVSETGDLNKPGDNEKIVRLNQQETERYFKANGLDQGFMLMKEGEQFQTSKDFISRQMFTSLNMPRGMLEESDKNYNKLRRELSTPEGIYKHIIAPDARLSVLYNQHHNDLIFSNEVQALREEKLLDLYSKQYLDKALYLPKAQYTGLATLAPGSLLENLVMSKTYREDIKKLIEEDNQRPSNARFLSPEMRALLQQGWEGKDYVYSERGNAQLRAYRKAHPGASEVYSGRYPASPFTVISRRLRRNQNELNLLKELGYSSEDIILTAAQQYQHNTGDFDGDTVNLIFGSVENGIRQRYQEMIKHAGPSQQTDTRLGQSKAPKRSSAQTKLFGDINPNNLTQEQAKLVLDSIGNYSNSQVGMGIAATAVDNAVSSNLLNKWELTKVAMELYDKATTLVKNPEDIDFSKIKQLITYRHMSKAQKSIAEYMNDGVSPLEALLKSKVISMSSDDAAWQDVMFLQRNVLSGDVAANESKHAWRGALAELYTGDNYDKTDVSYRAALRYAEILDSVSTGTHFVDEKDISDMTSYIDEMNEQIAHLNLLKGAGDKTAQKDIDELLKLQKMLSSGLSFMKSAEAPTLENFDQKISDMQQIRDIYSNRVTGTQSKINYFRRKILETRIGNVADPNDPTKNIDLKALSMNDLKALYKQQKSSQRSLSQDEIDQIKSYSDGIKNERALVSNYQKDIGVLNTELGLFQKFRDGVVELQDKRSEVEELIDEQEQQQAQQIRDVVDNYRQSHPNIDANSVTARSAQWIAMFQKQSSQKIHSNRSNIWNAQSNGATRLENFMSPQDAAALGIQHYKVDVNALAGFNGKSNAPTFDTSTENIGINSKYHDKNMVDMLIRAFDPSYQSNTVETQLGKIIHGAIETYVDRKNNQTLGNDTLAGIAKSFLLDPSLIPDANSLGSKLLFDVKTDANGNISDIVDLSTGKTNSKWSQYINKFLYDQSVNGQTVEAVSKQISYYLNNTDWKTIGYEGKFGIDTSRPTELYVDPVYENGKPDDQFKRTQVKPDLVQLSKDDSTVRIIDWKPEDVGAQTSLYQSTLYAARIQRKADEVAAFYKNKLGKDIFTAAEAETAFKNLTDKSEQENYNPEFLRYIQSNNGSYDFTQGTQFKPVQVVGLSYNGEGSVVANVTQDQINKMLALGENASREQMAEIIRFEQGKLTDEDEKYLREAVKKYHHITETRAEAEKKVDDIKNNIQKDKEGNAVFTINDKFLVEEFRKDQEAFNELSSSINKEKNKHTGMNYRPGDLYALQKMQLNTMFDDEEILAMLTKAELEDPDVAAQLRKEAVDMQVKKKEALEDIEFNRYEHARSGINEDINRLKAGYYGVKDIGAINVLRGINSKISSEQATLDNFIASYATPIVSGMDIATYMDALENDSNMWSKSGKSDTFSIYKNYLAQMKNLRAFEKEVGEQQVKLSAAQNKKDLSSLKSQFGIEDNDIIGAVSEYYDNVYNEVESYVIKQKISIQKLTEEMNSKVKNGNMSVDKYTPEEKNIYQRIINDMEQSIVDAQQQLTPDAMFKSITEQTSDMIKNTFGKKKSKSELEDELNKKYETQQAKLNEQISRMTRRQTKSAAESERDRLLAELESANQYTLSKFDLSEAYKTADETYQNQLTTQSVEDIQRNYDRQLRNWKNRGKRSAFLSRYTQYQDRKADLTSSYNKYNAQVEMYTTKRDELKQLIDNTDYAGNTEAQKKDLANLDELNNKLKLAQTNLDGTQQLLSQMNFSPLSVGLENVNDKLLQFANRLSYRLFMKATAEAKQFVIQFNKSLTDIQMVTQKTDSQMAQLGDGLIKKASELKASISEITSATQALYRQGLSDEEVAERSEDIIKFSRVSGVSAENATKLATVVTNAGLFNDVMQAFDVVSAVSDSAATNPDIITKAIQRSAYSAKSAGITGNELIALASAISSKTQLSGSVVGTSLSNVFSRLKRISANEIVYDEYGKASSTSNVQNALSAAGISLYDNGKEVNTVELLRRIADWRKNNPDNSVVYNAISYAVAGTGRQASNFQALIDAMSEVNENGESMIDMFLRLAETSEGTVDNKNAIYMNNLAAAMTDVKTSFDQLVEGFTDNAPITEFLEQISSMIKGLNAIMELGDGVVGTITGIGAALTVLAQLIYAHPILAIIVGGVGAVAKIADVIKNDWDNYKASRDFSTQINKRTEDVNKAQESYNTLKAINEKQLKGQTLSASEESKFVSSLHELVNLGHIKQASEDAIYGITDIGEKGLKVASELEAAAESITNSRRAIDQDNFNHFVENIETKYAEWASSVGFGDLTTTDVKGALDYIYTGTKKNDISGETAFNKIVSALFSADMFADQEGYTDVLHYIEEHSSDELINRVLFTLINPSADRVKSYARELGYDNTEDLFESGYLNKSDYERLYFSEDGYEDILISPIRNLSNTTRAEFMESDAIRPEIEKHVRSNLGLSDEQLKEYGVSIDNLVNSFVDQLYATSTLDTGNDIEKFDDIIKPLRSPQTGKFGKNEVDSFFEANKNIILANARLNQQKELSAYENTVNSINSAYSSLEDANIASNYRAALLTRPVNRMINADEEAGIDYHYYSDLIGRLGQGPLKGLIEGENKDEGVVRRLSLLAKKTNNQTLIFDEIDEFYRYLESKLAEFEQTTDNFTKADLMIEDLNKYTQEGKIFEDVELDNIRKAEIAQIIGTDTLRNYSVLNNISQEYAKLKIRSNATGTEATLSNLQLGMAGQDIFTRLSNNEDVKTVLSDYSSDVINYLYKSMPSLSKYISAKQNGTIKTDQLEKAVNEDIQKLTEAYEDFSEEAVNTIIGILSTSGETNLASIQTYRSNKSKLSNVNDAIDILNNADESLSDFDTHIISVATGMEAIDVQKVYAENPQIILTALTNMQTELNKYLDDTAKGLEDNGVNISTLSEESAHDKATKLYRTNRMSNNTETYNSIASDYQKYLEQFGSVKNASVHLFYTRYKELQTAAESVEEVSRAMETNSLEDIINAINAIIGRSEYSYLTDKTKTQKAINVNRQFRSVVGNKGIPDSRISDLKEYINPATIAALQSGRVGEREQLLLSRYANDKALGRNFADTANVADWLFTEYRAGTLNDTYKNLAADQSRDILNELFGDAIKTYVEAVDSGDTGAIETAGMKLVSTLVQAFITGINESEVENAVTTITNRELDPANYFSYLTTSRQSSATIGQLQQALEAYKSGSTSGDEILKSVLGVTDADLSNQAFKENILSAGNRKVNDYITSIKDILDGLKIDWKNPDFDVDSLEEGVRDWLVHCGIVIENGKISIDTSVLSDSIQHIINRASDDLIKSSDMVKYSLIAKALTGTKDEAINSYKEEVAKYSNGNVDVFNRPIIDSKTMRAAGYDVPEGSYATLYSTGYDLNIGGQSYLANMTPILRSGTVLNEQRLDNYVDYLSTLGSMEEAIAYDREHLRLLINYLEVPEGEDINKFRETLDYSANLFHEASEAVTANESEYNSAVLNRNIQNMSLADQELIRSTIQNDPLMFTLAESGRLSMQDLLNYVNKKTSGSFGTSLSDYNPMFKVAMGSGIENLQGWTDETFLTNMQALANGSQEDQMLFTQIADTISSLSSGADVIKELGNAMNGDEGAARNLNRLFKEMVRLLGIDLVSSANKADQSYDRVKGQLESLSKGGSDAIRTIGGIIDKQAEFNDQKSSFNKYAQGKHLKDQEYQEVASLIGVSKDSIKSATGSLRETYIDMGKAAIGFGEVELSSDFDLELGTLMNEALDKIHEKVGDEAFEEWLTGSLFVDGQFNIAGFLEMLNNVDAEVRSQIINLMNGWTNLGGTVGFTIDELGNIVVNSNTGSMGTKRSGRSSGGGGSKGKSDAEKLVEKLKHGQSLYEHQLKMYQYEETRYQTLDQLTNYARVLEGEIELEKSYLPVLEDNISALKSQMSVTSEGSEDWYKLRDALLEAEEKYSDITNTIEKNNKTLKENEIAIKKTHTNLEELVVAEIEKRIEEQRQQLAGSVDMQNIILETIKQNYREQWNLIKQDIDRKKKALEEEKSLIDQRLSKRKSAEDEALKYEELAELKRQYALISMDSSRSRDAASLRKQINDLEREIGWDLADKEAEAMSQAIQDQIDAFDEFASTGDEDLDKLLEDANNFGVEVKRILGLSHDDLMAWLRSNDESYRNSLSDAQQQIMNSWDDTWKQMYGIVDTYWDQVEQILSSETSFLDFMKQSTDYVNSSLDDQFIKMREWTEYYEKWMSAMVDTAKYMHTDVGSGGWTAGEYNPTSGSSGSSGSGGGGITSGSGSSTTTNVSETGQTSTVIKDNKGTSTTFTWEPTSKGTGGDYYLQYTNTLTNQVRRFYGYSYKEAVAAYNELLNSTGYNSGYVASPTVGLTSALGEGSKTTAGGNDTPVVSTKTSSSTSKSGSGTVSASGGSANLRSGPSSDTSKVGSVKSGATLTLTGKQQNGWYETSSGGWISGKLLKNVKFAKGGLADFTGPIQIDGTPNKPERILNWKQTVSFDKLVDLLDDVGLNTLSAIADEMNRWSTYSMFTPTLPSFDSQAMETYAQTIGDIIINIEGANLDSDADIDALAELVGQKFVKEISKQGFRTLGF